jgi:hypothetical protein
MITATTFSSTLYQFLEAHLLAFAMREKRFLFVKTVKLSRILRKHFIELLDEAVLQGATCELFFK